MREPTWSAELAEAVQELREQRPRWRKDELAPLLHQAGWSVSTSVVGRILTQLRKRGVLVEPLATHVAVRRPTATAPLCHSQTQGVPGRAAGRHGTGGRGIGVPGPVRARLSGAGHSPDLPPRSPKLNGSVERAQRTHTEEFYQVWDLPWPVTPLNRKLRAWERIYQTVRPHQA